MFISLPQRVFSFVWTDLGNQSDATRKRKKHNPRYDRGVHPCVHTSPFIVISEASLIGLVLYKTLWCLRMDFPSSTHPLNFPFFIMTELEDDGKLNSQLKIISITACVVRFYSNKMFHRVRARIDHPGDM